MCPNDANFTFDLPKEDLEILKVRKDGDSFVVAEQDRLPITQKHQIANFVDFCNECGNCDVFCPEDGGPYKVKPRFFSSEDDWLRQDEGDGFFVSRRNGTVTVCGRFNGKNYRLSLEGNRGHYTGEGFDLRYNIEAMLPSLEGEAAGLVDLTYAEIMTRVQASVLAGADMNYVRMLNEV